MSNTKKSSPSLVYNEPPKESKAKLYLSSTKPWGEKTFETMASIGQQ
jgi:hypothetical protein